MDSLKPIEDKLVVAFKDVPPLPKSTKKMFSDLLPWIALIFGVLQLLAAWGLYNWGRDINKLADAFNGYTSAFGVAAGVEKLSIFYWVSLVILIVDAVIMLMAYPGLKAKTKDGWNLIFLAVLVNVVYGVFSAFNSRGGAGSLVFSLIGSALGLYLLFQIRDHYAHKATAKDSATETN